MKHTPGPWKAESYICHAPTTIRSATGIVVAECSGHGRHTDESLSDARLIAAAPEMLEALNRALATLKVANIAGKSLYASDVTLKVAEVIRKAEDGQ